MSANSAEPHSEADQASRAALVALARDWIGRVSSPGGPEWLEASIEAVKLGRDRNALAMAIGLAPRKLGKRDLALDAADIKRADALYPGLDPSDWSVDQLARIVLMISAYRGDGGEFARLFDTFCETAEINELIALCRGLPLYPASRLLEPRAREAVRSGMRPIFESVAHRNPYPRDHFDEDAWNQMVVKAMFIGSSLWPIMGLDQRGNARLARMLVGLAQERQAAGRRVSAEIWRCVAPHADAEGEMALVKVVGSAEGKDLPALAAALALASEAVRARVITASGRGDLVAALHTAPFDWKEAS